MPPQKMPRMPAFPQIDFFRNCFKQFRGREHARDFMRTEQRQRLLHHMLLVTLGLLNLSALQ